MKLRDFIEKRASSKKKHAVSAKIHFNIDPLGNSWKVYIIRPKTEQTSPIAFLPKPDISICYSPEQGGKLAEVTVSWADTIVTMKASYFSYETKVLGIDLCGYDQSQRCVVWFREDSDLTVSLTGMSHFFEGERFTYACTAERVTFHSGEETVMEVCPTFVVGLPGRMQIKGWIDEAYLSYLPYLSGILGYVHLT